MSAIETAVEFDGVRTLDPHALRPIFARTGRLHLPDVFQPRTAEAIGRALAGETRWRRSMNPGGRGLDLSQQELADLAPEKRRALEALTLQGARQGFQYAFDTWRISDAVEAGRRSGDLLEAVFDRLNGRAFLDFVAAMTGEPRVAYCDAQATRYRPGDFLTAHDDHADGKQRLFAYVLNFTPQWRADWGGLLLFHDQDGHVAEGFTPAFNALNIFRVPQLHSVSLVAPYAGRERLSITGWVRAR
ncbi:2OG-Fe(II) oxygenase family protein [Caulobacter sp. 17J65-9]|uniref:2OG-Fe(II) oxygenase n=1 Tax=Caulobacter sp. 17J65-9 TaxID=2709382 RepID=UPI0013C77C08|nr:2OG-Fe(II) oxygenase family protein [Caulobacter sp. 17J65-9]NEX94441.1 hypothetical protein [Caulobacter sp. 17J65-9]